MQFFYLVYKFVNCAMSFAPAYFSAAMLVHFRCISLVPSLVQTAQKRHNQINNSNLFIDSERNDTKCAFNTVDTAVADEMVFASPLQLLLFFMRIQIVFMICNRLLFLRRLSLSCAHNTQMGCTLPIAIYSRNNCARVRACVWCVEKCQSHYSFCLVSFGFNVELFATRREPFAVSLSRR